MPKARAQEKRAYCISVSWVRLGKSVPSGQTGTDRAHTAHRVYVTVRVRLCDINTYLHGQNITPALENDRTVGVRCRDLLLPSQGGPVGVDRPRDLNRRFQGKSFRGDQCLGSGGTPPRPAAELRAGVSVWRQLMVGSARPGPAGPRRDAQRCAGQRRTAQDSAEPAGPRRDAQSRAEPRGSRAQPQIPRGPVRQSRERIRERSGTAGAPAARRDTLRSKAPSQRDTRTGTTVISCCGCGTEKRRQRHPG